MAQIVTRYPDWELRLSEFFRECVEEKVCLDWENFHCGSWAADAIIAITGFDPLEAYRGITNPLRIAKAMKKNGVFSQATGAANLFTEVPVVYAQRGDLLMVPSGAFSEPAMETLEAIKAMGVDLFSDACCIADPPFAWTLTEEGLGRLPILTAHRAFSIGGI